jgi:hypothetical protein
MRQRTGSFEGPMRILNKTMLLAMQRRQSAAMSMLMTVRVCWRIILRRGMLMVKITMMERIVNTFDKKDLFSSKDSTTSTKSNSETEESLAMLSLCISMK